MNTKNKLKFLLEMADMTERYWSSFQKGDKLTIHDMAKGVSDLKNHLDKMMKDKHISSRKHKELSKDLMNLVMAYLRNKDENISAD